MGKQWHLAARPRLKEAFRNGPSCLCPAKSDRSYRPIAWPATLQNRREHGPTRRTTRASHSAACLFRTQAKMSWRCVPPRPRESTLEIGLQILPRMPSFATSRILGEKKLQARQNWRTKIDQHNKGAKKKGLHVYWCYGHGENMACKNCRTVFDFSGAVANNNVAGRAAKYMRRPCKALVVLERLASASSA